MWARPGGDWHFRLKSRGGALKGAHLLATCLDRRSALPTTSCGYRDPCFHPCSHSLTFRALLYIMVYITGEEGLIVRQKAKVFTNGRSQAVRLPAAFRFDTKEVFIDRNPRTGDVILSRKPANWSEVFAALDRAGVPEDLLAGRDRSLPQERETV